ncbi:MAG: hypothetical protein H6983_26520 [Ectothiorhodospiraceae bacterium]|nr:hypothetical protein [Ectothiorhodospiraceae bacterium]
MARGKHAASAANRRADAARTALDHSAAELAAAKVRYRTAEAEAAKVPTLLAKIDQLQSMLDEATCPEIERLQARSAEAARTAADRFDLARGYIAQLMAGLRHYGGDQAMFATDASVVAIERLGVWESLWLVTPDRESRRGREFGRTRANREGSALFRRYRDMTDAQLAAHLLSDAENYDKVMMTLEAEGR